MSQLPVVYITCLCVRARLFPLLLASPLKGQHILLLESLPLLEKGGEFVHYKTNMRIYACVCVHLVGKYPNAERRARIL